MIRLSSSSPVTARTRSGGRAIPARSSTLISVPSPSMTAWPNSASSCSYRSRRCSSSVTSWPMSTSERATFFPPFPPPTMIMYSLLLLSRRARRLEGTHVARADRLGQHRDRRLRRAYGAQAPLGVEVGAQRVEDAHDDAVDAVALLQHLPDHDVRVVAVGRDDRGVGLLGPRVAQDVAVHPVTDDERAAPVAEPDQRLFLLVDARHVPAFRGELHGDGGADPATPDHHAFHGVSVA